MAGANFNLLIENLKRGDTNALHVIFDSFYVELCRFARMTLPSHEDAEDLVQEIFIHLWEKRESLEINNLKAYLYQAVKFRCINFIKRKKTDFESLSENEPIATHSEKGFPDEEETFGKALRNAVKNLPEQNRTVFILSKKFGLSHKEIASQLDISTKTVENHITAAVKRIRLYIKENKEVLLLFLTFFSKIF